MTDYSKANELRIKGDIDAALPLFKELWGISKDKFVGAGLIFCLRKKKNYVEAISLGEETNKLFPDFKWSKNEYIWSLIQGKLIPFPEEGSVVDLLGIIDKILKLEPDQIGYKITIFKLLKCAKKNNNWNILNEWITKLDPSNLPGYSDKETGWTDKVLWYYYRVIGLIYTQNEEEAITLLNQSCGEFYKQRKYFERLKAKAYINLNKFDEALQIYVFLASGKPDWWLLHEYGNLLLKLDKLEEGFACLIKAAITPPNKPALKVTLYNDIGSLLIKLNRPKQASIHLKLAKAVREDNGWGIGDLNEKISNLDEGTSDNIDFKTLFVDCQKIWEEFLHEGKLDCTKNKMNIRYTGKVISIIKGRPFCFIKTTDDQSFYCRIKDLPSGTTNNQVVKFKVEPTFDKKKNKETFRAVNIKR